VYAILDIETTGGNPYRDKITEIAVFLHDGKQVVREFSTLVNPERSIPFFITRMTGITDEMVAKAPRFFEIAKELVEITRDSVIVAHNSSFDYNFIRNEFRSLGYTFSREQLCTVKLSRKLLPGKASYSLGRLCRELNISIENRHRAAGDALATVKLFELLMQQNGNELYPELMAATSHLQQINPDLTRETLQKLPDKTGVYYFFGKDDRIIYIGKSKNIRQRVLTHLGRINSKKALEMAGQIRDIQYEETGSELAALLLESEEIRTHQPVFNRRQRRSLYNFGLYSQTTPEGYHALMVDSTSQPQTPHTTFSSREKGRDFLFALVEKFNLCQNLSGLYSTNGACFQYAVKQCRGACLGKEPAEEYNLRVAQALEYAALPAQNLVLIDKGRHHDEKFILVIENGRITHRGYAEPSAPGITEPESFRNLLPKSSDNRNLRQIVSGFLRNRKLEKVLPF
jgi:DNA polymerase III subunit epsilon